MGGREGIEGGGGREEGRSEEGEWEVEGEGSRREEGRREGGEGRRGRKWIEREGMQDSIDCIEKVHTVHCWLGCIHSVRFQMPSS